MQQESGAAIKSERAGIVGRDEQADLAARRDLPEPAHDRGDDPAAAAATLMPAVDAEPAEPPAAAVAAVRMDGVEADEVTALFDPDEVVGQATTDGLDDIVERS